MTKIFDISDAVRKVANELKHQERKKLAIVLDCNKGRYKLLYFFGLDQSREVILVLFKREHFLSYNKQFDTDAGHGESINKEDLDKAINDRGVARVFIVYSDGKIYMIPSKAILSEAKIRKTNNEDKETYSFDMKLLTRYNKDD